MSTESEMSLVCLFVCLAIYLENLGLLTSLMNVKNKLSVKLMKFKMHGLVEYFERCAMSTATSLIV